MMKRYLLLHQFCDLLIKKSVGSLCLVYQKNKGSLKGTHQNQLHMVTHPTVSILGDMMMTPARLVRPTVGFIPTTEL